MFIQLTGDPIAAQQLAWQALESLRQRQTSAFAYFDVFLMLTVVTLGLVPVVLLMKRSHRWRMSRWGQTVQQRVLFVSSVLRVQ